LSSSFSVRLPNQAILNVAPGSPFPSFDFVEKSVHSPVGSAPAAAAMLANLNMLGTSWDLQQQYQLQQLQQQKQQLLYNQQQLQFSHALSNLLLGQQSASSPLAPCPLPAFGGMAPRF
jgi:hypothetical protein